MLRQLMAVAAMTAMLGANAAAYAITSARAAATSITPGAAASDENPPRIDGRTILPSIPEPPEPAPVTRKVSAKAPAGKAGESRPKNAKAKARAPKAAKSRAPREAKSRAPREAKSRALKAKPTREKPKRAK